MNSTKKDTMERHAVMAQSSYLRTRKDRQKLIDKYYNGEYELLDNYSDKIHTTYRNKSTGDITLAIRGTDIQNQQGGRIKDLATDVMVGFGIETLSNRYKKSDKMVEKLKTDFKGKKLTLASHSLGTSIAQNLSYKHDIESHGFSAGASPAHSSLHKHRVLHPKNKWKKGRNNIYLSTPKGFTDFDPISISATINPMANVEWVEKKKLPAKEKGVLEAHSIYHFFPEKATM